MRRAIVIFVCSSCATNPEAPTSHAQLTASVEARASRAQPGFVSYGAPYHKWTISFAAREGCGETAIASVEINTLASITDVPLGTIPIRTTETTINALPSAYVRFMGGTVISGNVTIETASTGFVSGELTSQLMINGTPTDVSGSFGAPICGE
ncbi:MAG: hypothetical protein SFX73_06620 [Kofleriaceae bacterium]|nr:hypothetical protein [Kofleriaceae bacterium]